jgi:hypothetical protein
VKTMKEKLEQSQPCWNREVSVAQKIENRKRERRNRNNRERYQSKHLTVGSNNPSGQDVKHGGSMQDTKATTISEFIEKHALKFEIRPVNSRPDGLMNELPMFHYRVRIISQRFGSPKPASFGLYFSTGKGWKTAPTLADCLNSCADDASSYDNAKDFNDFCNELGYSTDSRKAEKMFRACKRQSDQLKRVLGEEAYAELLYDVERL